MPASGTVIHRAVSAIIRAGRQELPTLRLVHVLCAHNASHQQQCRQGREQANIKNSNGPPPVKNNYLAQLQKFTFTCHTYAVEFTPTVRAVRRASFRIRIRAFSHSNSKGLYCAFWFRLHKPSLSQRKVKKCTQSAVIPTKGCKFRASSRRCN